jgi:hypothetical protein
VNITGSSPFLCQTSFVSIIISNSNQISTTASDHRGIECASVSNLTFSPINSGSLFVFGGNLSAGNGTGSNGACENLLFVNDSYSVSGEAGIGLGQDSSGSASVTTISILGDVIITIGGHFGAGIGSGQGSTGSSRFSRLAIFDGDITAPASNSSAGICSGQGDYGGSSVVSDLLIFNGKIAATGLREGAGIGSCQSCLADGTSIVVNLDIFNGVMTALRLAKRSGIGAGQLKLGHLRDLHPLIHGDNINATGAQSCVGIGTRLANNGTCTIANPMIFDGYFMATNFAFGAEIEAGQRSGGSSILSNLVIFNGTINATVAGEGDSSRVMIRTIKIGDNPEM